MTAIAPTAEVDKLRQVASIAGLKVHRIDLTAAASVRTVIRDYGNSRTVRAVIDVGATTTRVVVAEGLHVQEIRTILSGGQELTESISAAIGCSVQEAESTKWGLRLDTETAGRSYGNDEFGVSTQEELPDQDKALAAELRRRRPHRADCSGSLDVQWCI